MDYLVKIDHKKRYVRITIPIDIVRAVDLKKYKFALVRATGSKTIEVEGVEIKGQEERKVSGDPA